MCGIAGSVGPNTWVFESGGNLAQKVDDFVEHPPLALPTCPEARGLALAPSLGLTIKPVLGSIVARTPVIGLTQTMPSLVLSTVSSTTGKEAGSLLLWPLSGFLVGSSSSKGLRNSLPDLEKKGLQVGGSAVFPRRLSVISEPDSPISEERDEMLGGLDLAGRPLGEPDFNLDHDANGE